MALGPGSSPRSSPTPRPAPAAAPTGWPRAAARRSARAGRPGAHADDHGRVRDPDDEQRGRHGDAPPRRARRGRSPAAEGGAGGRVAPSRPIPIPTAPATSQTMARGQQQRAGHRALAARARAAAARRSPKTSVATVSAMASTVSGGGLIITSTVPSAASPAASAASTPVISRAPRASASTAEAAARSGRRRAGRRRCRPMSGTTPYEATSGGGSPPKRTPIVSASAMIPMPVMTSATPPTMTASVAAAVASPRCSGARACAPRRRTVETDAARIVRVAAHRRRIVRGRRRSAATGTVYSPRGCRSSCPRIRRPSAGPASAQWVSFAFAVAARRPARLPRLRRLRGIAPADRCAQRLDRLPHAGRLRLDVRGHQLPHRDRCAPSRPRRTRRTAPRRAPRPATRSRPPTATRLAGWYVPSGSGSGPTGPTVILVHGWSSNKSTLLDRAALLHDALQPRPRRPPQPRPERGGADDPGRPRGR